MACHFFYLFVPKRAMSLVLLHLSLVTWHEDLSDVFSMFCKSESIFKAIQGCLFCVHKTIKKRKSMESASSGELNIPKVQEQWFGILPEFSRVIVVKLDPDRSNNPSDTRRQTPNER